MLSAYLNFWKNYANFSGRARRGEYWWPLLVHSIIFGILGSVSMGQMTTAMVYGAPISGVSIVMLVIYVILCLAIIIPSLSVVVRRLHDTGKSGWWFFISFVPVAGGIIMLVFMCIAGTPGMNQYGADPTQA